MVSISSGSPGKWTPETNTPAATPADNDSASFSKIGNLDAFYCNSIASPIGAKVPTSKAHITYIDEELRNKSYRGTVSNNPTQLFEEKLQKSHFLKVVNGSNVHLIQGQLESLLKPFCLFPSGKEFWKLRGENERKQQSQDLHNFPPASGNEKLCIVDHDFRQSMINKREKGPSRGEISQLFRKRLAETQSLASNSRIPKSTDSSSISCSWYMSSGSARLKFESSRKALKAKKALEQYLFFGRSLLFSWDKSQREVWGPIGKPTITLVVGNLDPRTSRVYFEEALTSTLTPNSIEISPAEDSSENSKHVEELLRKFGTVSSFQYKTVDSASTEVRAYATFSSREAAIAAVDSLHKTDASLLNPSLLFAKHIISVNYLLPSELNRHGIQEQHWEYWDNGQLHYTIYRPANSNSKNKLMGLKIFGDTAEHVAKSKQSAENFLNGTVVMAAYSPFWHKYFMKPGSTEHLDDLRRVYGLHTRYDSMTSQLFIHGGSAAQRKEIEDRLEARIKSLRRPSRKVLAPLSQPTNSKLEIRSSTATVADYQQVDDNRGSVGEAPCEYEVGNLKIVCATCFKFIRENHNN